MDRADRVSILAQIVRQIITGPGACALALRKAAYDGDRGCDEFAEYLRKVRSEAYRLTNEDIESLRAHGATDDQVFELTVAAALGESTRRLQIALAAMRKSGGR